MITITVDTSRFDRMMADFPAAMERARRKALNQIGNTVRNRTTAAFRSPSLRPSPWAPRKDKKSTHPLLLKSTTMWRSIEYRVTGPDTVVIGSSTKYAPYHQHGTKNMPARPFFPIDSYGNLLPDVRETINRKVQKAFSDELGKLGGGKAG